MPKGGVKELQQSPAGRKYLSKLQKRHALDILQPGDPKFDKVYGPKLRAQKREKQRQIEHGKYLKDEYENRSQYEVKRHKDHGHRKFY